jgi:hypothetical protein
MMHGRKNLKCILHSHMYADLSLRVSQLKFYHIILVC